MAGSDTVSIGPPRPGWSPIRASERWSLALYGAAWLCAYPPIFVPFHFAGVIDRKIPD